MITVRDFIDMFTASTHLEIYDLTSNKVVFSGESIKAGFELQELNIESIDPICKASVCVNVKM